MLVIVLFAPLASIFEGTFRIYRETTISVMPAEYYITVSARRFDKPI
jgi:hypothetical protein